MSQRNSEYERKERDLYETPEWVTEALLDFLPPTDSLVIWEPACGSGKMASVLKATWSSDLVTDYGTSGIDFLDCDVLPEHTNAIITNPPFNKAAEAFIRHGMKLLSASDGDRWMAMLLPVDFDSAKTRRDMFADCPYFYSKIVLTSRIVWFDYPGRKSSPSTNHAWFVWQFTPDRDRPTIDYHFKKRS